MSHIIKPSLLETLNIRPADNTALDGDLIEIFRGEEEFMKIGGLNQVTKRTLTSDIVSGNHYHLTKSEIIYVWRGIIIVYLKDPNKSEVFKTEVKEGQKFNLMPRIAHALYSPLEKSEIEEFANLAFDPKNPKNDIYPHKVFCLENNLP